ncbi:GNAT family N-acetyltransferase [Pseudalkalibacillus berkeleyi]|uniref:GNAT family N-acetyltransferase n=1 Tax=Pseudalkalibacillus berkeleyi TaxID=1069813 RepID=UPI002E33285A|nr:GNAT family N-acetyltransferase [Pseudalkalibacillus berkeleyi]
MTGEDAGEVYVLYMDPNRRGEGVGTKLLAAITDQQVKFGAKFQWVSVQKGNAKGIPFYEAKGFQPDSECVGYGNTEEEHYVSVRYCREV